MRAFVISALLAVPTLAAANSPFHGYPASVRPLLAQDARLDERCRGGLGDDPATDRACRQRAVVEKRINRLGYCWGPDGSVEADKRWMRCGRRAHPDS